MKIEDIKVNGYYRAISNHQVVVCTGVFSNHGVFFGTIVSEGKDPLMIDETRGSSGIWTSKDYEPFDAISPLTPYELRRGK